MNGCQIITTKRGNSSNSLDFKEVYSLYRFTEKTTIYIGITVFYVSLIPYTGFFIKDYRYYITLLKQFKSKFADKYGILKIGIFGSVARGEQTEKSDLEKRCGCPIDLIRLRKSLRPLLLDKILKEGIYA